MPLLLLPIIGVTGLAGWLGFKAGDANVDRVVEKPVLISSNTDAYLKIAAAGALIGAAIYVFKKR